MLTVFYSASEKSKEYYTAIYQKLKSMHENNIILLIHFPGFNYIEEQNYFPKAIMLAIEDSDIIVALLDEEGRRNQWINQEVGYAMAKGINILALAESRKELMGFVNMNTNTVLEGDKVSLPLQMEVWLNKLGESKAEEIFERILITKLIEIQKIIDWEKNKPYQTQLKNQMAPILDNMIHHIETLLSQKEKHGFLPTYDLKILQKNYIPQVSEIAFSDKFKKHCKDFEDDIIELLKIRRKRFE